MALRKVVHEGDPILRKVCRPVGNVTDRTRELLDDMVETMRDAEGVGLAAPQVGVMRRLFVAEPNPGEVYKFVDPVITETEGEQTGMEGCLSLPGYVGTVTRPERIVIEATDENGEHVKYEFMGFRAVVMCHEYDHLDGILYKDKAEDYRPADEEYEEDGEEDEQ
jgi:peptide deformylase